VQPEAAARRLRAALEDLGVWPVAPSEQQALTNRVLQYVGLLTKWNRAYNLTAVREPERMLVQHVFDSAAVARPLRELVEARRAQAAASDTRPRVVDVGSGAGLPGIVLALLWPEADFLLVEPVGKKAAFLQQAVSELALTNVSVAQQRVEDLPARSDPPEAIVCRAFASLAEYAKAIEPLVGPATVVVAMKARPDENEKSALTNGWQIRSELPLRVPELYARRTLVVLARAGGATTSRLRTATESLEQQRRE
jgi:16S rRNA (guanine527-N7)-methyltransferase